MATRRKFITASAAIPLLYLPINCFAAGQVRQINGTVYINNKPANKNSIITTTDEIKTGQDSSLEFVLDEDAYRIGSQSTLQLASTGNIAVQALRLLTGSLLGVFGMHKERTMIYTSIATIGIRGTGVFVKTDIDRIYTCTCYGTTDLIAGGHMDVVSATHHNAHIVSHHPDGTMTMQATGVRDHSDDDLRRLESYVGRIPDFDRI